MSEAWRKLIETDDRALADCLSLGEKVDDIEVVDITKI